MRSFVLAHRSECAVCWTWPSAAVRFASTTHFKLLRTQGRIFSHWYTCTYLCTRLKGEDKFVYKFNQDLKFSPRQIFGRDSGVTCLITCQRRRWTYHMDCDGRKAKVLLLLFLVNTLAFEHVTNVMSTLLSVMAQRTPQWRHVDCYARILIALLHGVKIWNIIRYLKAFVGKIFWIREELSLKHQNIFSIDSGAK
jgi:hypothetical protein